MDLELFAYFLVESAGIGVEHSGNDGAQFFVQSAKAIFTAYIFSCLISLHVIAYNLAFILNQGDKSVRWSSVIDHFHWREPQKRSFHSFWVEKKMFLDNWLYSCSIGSGTKILHPSWYKMPIPLVVFFGNPSDHTFTVALVQFSDALQHLWQRNADGDFTLVCSSSYPKP